MSDFKFSDIISQYEDEDDVLQNPTSFSFNGSNYCCKICPGDQRFSLAKAILHEDTETHARRAREADGRLGASDVPQYLPHADWNEPVSPRPYHDNSSLPPSSPPSDLAPSHMHQSGTVEDDDYPPDPALEEFTVHGPALASDPADQLYNDWGGFLAYEKPKLASPLDHLSPGVLLSDDDMYGPGISYAESTATDNSDDDFNYSVNDKLFPSSEDDPLQPSESQNFAPSDNVELPDDEDWWPWLNEKSCLLDVLSAFPRSAFSESEMEITRWFATRLGVRGIPSVRTVKSRRSFLHSIAGTTPEILKSDLGNFYCKTSLARILAHEVANPLIRSKLHFYPEDSGPRLAEARQADRWLHEVEATFSGPMVRVGSQDYFVDEPALAKLNDTPTPVLPVRFFQREKEMFASVHQLSVDDSNESFLVDAITEDDCFVIPVKSLLLSYPRFIDGHSRYGLPDPSKVTGIRHRIPGPRAGPSIPPPCEITSWSGVLPNPWRVKAAGRRVLPLPMWWYLTPLPRTTTIPS